jgi:pimeloyl-ACP methyl ester carboxylesterase
MCAGDLPVKTQRFLALAAIAATIGTAGCAPYAAVSSVSPRYHPAGTLAPVERRISTGLGLQRREPLEAIGEFLAAAQTAQQQLARDPANIAARDAYNFAVARTIGTIQQARLDPWSQPLRVPAAGGDFVLTHKRNADPRYDPAHYDLIPADQLRIKGAYVREREIKQGIGAPVVVVERGSNPDAHDEFMMPRLYYGVTALIRFENGRAVVSYEDPLATERVTFAGHSFLLAADFTAPIAVLLVQQDPRKLEISGLLHPDDQAGSARIARSGPYDPCKTVVLIIHGLKDSPATWVPMLNHLQADEELRRNYQVWFYSYPSGYPYPHSAAILRRELDAIERRFPLRKKMVVIGHSMGGCIARLLITDTGDKLWREIFQKPPDRTALSASSKAQLREDLIFRHRPEIGRVIFIAAPLRGSELARNWVGRIGSALVKLPSTVRNTGNDAIRAVTFHRDELRMERAPNSVDFLTPNNRLVRALDAIPVAPGIPHHVICGDRGKGGHKDKTRPIMSDGVVPYWSSHMEKAKSELIVPSGHNAHQNPQAIAEVGRILRLHAGR